MLSIAFRDEVVRPGGIPSITASGEVLRLPFGEIAGEIALAGDR